MTKYRIRLPNGRVMGPFEKPQLFELKAKGHIKGEEEAQIFPTGNWGPIQQFDFYPELMDENRTSLLSENTVDENTFVIDLTKLRLQQQESELEKIDEVAPLPITELTETVRMSPTEQKVALEKLDELLPANTGSGTAVTRSQHGFVLDTETLDEEAERSNTASSDRTIINPVAQQELERMRRKEKEEAERQKAEEERLKAEEEARALALAAEEAKAVVPVDESTQMIRLDKTGLLEVAEESEIDFEKELKRIRKEEAKAQAAAKEDDDEEDDEASNSKKKTKRLIIIAAAAAILYAIFFPEEEPKKPAFQHIEPRIVFPIPFDKADSQKSKVHYTQGLKHFNEGTYPALIKAGLSFKNSYENDMDNAEALNFMVRTYAEQLIHSKDRLMDAQTLFNIIQSKRPFLIQNPNGVIGLNLFYMAIEKPNAAIDVVQKYLKLNPKNVTQDLFAVYVQSLLKIGKIDVAKQFLTALERAPQKSPYTYRALVEYHLLNQETQKAMEYAGDALKNYPNLASLNLLVAELLIKEKKDKEAIPYIKRAEDLQLDYNNLNRGKFFELKGYTYGLNGKPAEAVKYLGYALKLNDNDELRIRLSELDTEGVTSDAVMKLKNESLAVKLLLQAKDFHNKKNYELAMSTAAKATDAFPGYIPAELFLAKMQMKLGLATQGLKTLESLVAKYPDDKAINIALIEAYINTFKFNDARTRIQIISTAEYRDSWEFASVNGKLNQQMGDTLQAMSWYKNSISINPLNDQDIFALAEILIRRANFDAARVLLNKSMELDPLNPDYRIAYARLIYETQDDRAAIGYLLSLQDDFGESPKVLSEIAIFYYRSGQVKAFQEFKERLEKHHSKDKSLYEFLIKAALLDERYSDIPGLVEKLLAIEPGEIEYMMTAGRVLFENGKLVDAAKWFKRIQEKLPSYPMVRYYIGRIMFLSGDTKGAMDEIDKDIAENGESDISLVFKGQVYQEQGNFIEAENSFKKAQKINPKSYDAIIGLADLSTKRNNHDLALDLYKRAMKLRQDEPIVHKKIGDVYRQLGQGALAIESYKMYLEMDPESPHKRNLEAYINLMK